MKALVTGASGFLGAQLCALLVERGHETVALVRRPGSAPLGTTEVVADLGDAASVRDALATTHPDTVFHLAAEIATQRDEDKVHAVNVVGTHHLLEGCRATGAPTFVFTSTVVTGDAHGALLDEQTALPVETAYGRSKQEGEELVFASGLPAVVIRPSHVYGPGGWFGTEIVDRLRSPFRLAVVGHGDNLWDMVHVDDVAAACLLAAESIDRAAGQVFHCVDDEPTTYYDFLALTARELGLGRPRRVPIALARLIAGGPAVAAVTRSARSSNAKLKRDLGWRPAYPTVREGVPAALAALAAAR